MFMKLIVIDKLNSGVTLTLKIGQGHSSSNSTCNFLRCICTPNEDYLKRFKRYSTSNEF